MDKYSLIVVAPSVAVVVGCVALVFFGAAYLKKAMVVDAEKAAQKIKISE